MQKEHLVDNEQELVAQAIKDPEAFAALYEYYFPRIYNYIFCRVGKWSTTDDLTSLVFEKAFARINSYRIERAVFSTWLFTIAKNTVTDHFHKQKKEICLKGKVTKDFSLKTVDTETTVLLSEDKQNLISAISKLDERQKNIIGLKFWSGLKNTEIAKVVGISENNVAVILYRALNSLKILLEESK